MSVDQSHQENANSGLEMCPVGTEAHLAEILDIFDIQK